MSATPRRSGGSHQRFRGSRRLRSDEVARRFEDLGSAPGVKVVYTEPPKFKTPKPKRFWMIPLGLVALVISVIYAMMTLPYTGTGLGSR